jgi:hypothetical protein
MSVGLALAAALAAQAAGPPPAPEPSVEAVQVDIRPGRDERCAVNPPLLFAAEEAVQIEPGGSYDLERLAAGGKPVRLIAFGPGASFKANGDKDRAVTLAVDELSLRSGELTSATGAAWTLFERAGTGPRPRLVPRGGDYSLCKHQEQVAARPATRGFRVSLPDRRTGLPRRSGVQAMVSAGARAILDIFGLNAGSFVRIRLRSDPSDADIYLGGTLQPPRTDTVLDVIAAELPHLRLEKTGFAPCAFERWTTAFEPRSNNRVLNATCKLMPLKPGRSRQ